MVHPTFLPDHPLMILRFHPRWTSFCVFSSISSSKSLDLAAFRPFYTTITRKNRIPSTFWGCHIGETLKGWNTFEPTSLSLFSRFVRCILRIIPSRIIIMRSSKLMATGIQPKSTDEALWLHAKSYRFYLFIAAYRSSTFDSLASHYDYHSV